MNLMIGGTFRSFQNDLQNFENSNPSVERLLFLILLRTFIDITAAPALKTITYKVQDMRVIFRTICANKNCIKQCWFQK